jgi:hypothetical protein
MDWAVIALAEILVTGANGSAPSNEVFCCNIRRSRTFVRSMGFGWSVGMICTMNVVATAENKPA